jgi:hypothetical protein
LFEQLPPPATHLPATWSQQPPLAQTLPSQHGWPAPPQVAHLPLPGSQVSPVTVQKSPDLPL